MYMNLKPNQHKRISFNTTTMTSLGFIGPPKNLVPPNYFGLKFLGPPRKLGGGGSATMIHLNLKVLLLKAFWLCSKKYLMIEVS